VNINYLKVTTITDRWREAVVGMTSVRRTQKPRLLVT